MSMHKEPLTPLEEAGLRAHGLDIGTPSQLSDVFRQGVRYALANQPGGGEHGDAYQGAREDLSDWKRRALEAETKLRERPLPGGWAAKRTEDGEGFIVSSPRIDGVASHTVVFKDSPDVASCMLWRMLSGDV